MHKLVKKAEVFTAAEVTCAIELIDEALKHPQAGYYLLVACIEENIVGYTCYGPTGLTEDTWDLYWIATDSQRRNQGVGSALIDATETAISSKKGKRIRVETSSQESHIPAQNLYKKHGYPEIGRISNFYKPGDDLILFCKVLSD